MKCPVNFADAAAAMSGGHMLLERVKVVVILKLTNDLSLIPPSSD